MSQQLYIRIRGRTQGPFDLEKLRSLVKRGQLGRFHDVSEDNVSWGKASDYPELFDTGASQIVQQKVAARPDAAARAASAPSVADRGDTGDSAQWHYAIGNKSEGPVDQAMIMKLIKSGKLGSEDQVWRDGMLTWSPVSEVPELAKHLPRHGGVARSSAASKPFLPSHAKPIAISLAVVVLVLLAAAALRSLSVPEHAGQDLGRPPRWRGDSDLLTSIRDQDGIYDAMGKVVWGWELLFVSGAKKQIEAGSGSAFAISSEGFMLTNKHVVEDFDNLSRAIEQVRLARFAKMLGPSASDLVDAVQRIDARLWVFVAHLQKDGSIDFEPLEAKLRLVHPTFDLAIIEVDHRFRKKFRLLDAPPRRLLDREIRAIGYPAILARKSLSDNEEASTSITSDIASAFKDRDLHYVMTDGRVSQVVPDTATKLNWLHHTAEIAHGNSGGPLVDRSALVLGINTKYAGDDAANFYRSFCLSEVRDDIDRRVPDVHWVDRF